MSIFHTRPTTNALQRIMGSFKQFEKKLDKLQDDVSYHGQTLNQLHNLLLNNIPTGTILAGQAVSEIINNELKRPHKKVPPPVSDGNRKSEQATRYRRSQAIKPIPVKKGKIQMTRDQYPKKYTVNYATQGTRSSPEKHTVKGMRQKKGEAPRKATTLTCYKPVTVKHNKKITTD